MNGLTPAVQIREGFVDPDDLLHKSVLVLKECFGTLTATNAFEVLLVIGEVETGYGKVPARKVPFV